MDNATHTLTGLMLARIGLNRVAPQATAALLLSSNLPDADILYTLGGAWNYLHYHRHWTHGLPMVPVMALLNVLLLWLFGRVVRTWKPAFAEKWKTGWGWTYLISVLGLVIHVLYDATNSYGVRAALPISADWYSLDLFFVVDPVILALLLLAIVAPAISGMVSSEIGGKKTTGRGWAVFALVLILAYGGCRAMLRERALSILESHIYPQGAAQRIEAWPTAFSPWTWIGYVETAQSWGRYTLDLNAPFDTASGSIAYRPVPHSAITKAWESEEGRTYREFARFAAWRLVPQSEPEGSVAVEANDLRFGEPGAKAFQFRMLFDRQLNRMGEKLTYGRPDPK